jgi:hypothetical protein
MARMMRERFIAAGRDDLARRRKEPFMLWMLALVLLVLWGLGLITPVAMGGLVHLFLVAAIVVVLVRVALGRRVF